MTAHHPPIRRPRRRAVALAVASLCLLAQVLAVSHATVVQHVRCAAHGELVHADAVPSHVDHAARDGRPIEIRDGAAAVVGSHDHEHCGAIANQRLEGVSIPDAEMTPAPLSPAPSSPVAKPRADAWARYRLAPKSSPPRG